MFLIHLTFARTQKGQKDFEKMIIGCSLIRSSTQSWTFFPSRSLLFMMILSTNEKVLQKNDTGWNCKIERYRFYWFDEKDSVRIFCDFLIESDFSWERINFRQIVSSRKVFKMYNTRHWTIIPRTFKKISRHDGN